MNKLVLSSYSQCVSEQASTASLLLLLLLAFRQINSLSLASQSRLHSTQTHLSGYMEAAANACFCPVVPLQWGRADRWFSISASISLSIEQTGRPPTHPPPPLLMNKHAIPLFTPPSVADKASWLFCLTPLLLHPCRIFITDNIHGKYRLWARRLISLEEQTSAPVSVCLSVVFSVCVSPKQRFCSSWRLAPH